MPLSKFSISSPILSFRRSTNYQYPLFHQRHRFHLNRSVAMKYSS